MARWRISSDDGPVLHFRCNPYRPDQAEKKAVALLDKRGISKSNKWLERLDKLKGWRRAGR